MTKDTETGNVLLRNLPQSVLEVGTQIAIAQGTNRAELFRQTLIKTYTDLISSFENSDPLVAALDNTLALQLGCEIITPPEYNFMGIQSHLDMCKILNIKEHNDLRNILVRNTPYILPRAIQVLGNNGPVIKGTSLWFALFVEVAFSSKDTIENAAKKIFNRFRGSDYLHKYYENINALRKLNKLEPVGSEKLTANETGKNCRVYIFKPTEYQYGAWRIKMNINANIKKTEFNFPVLPQRLFVAQASEPYSSVNVNHNNDVNLGFKFINNYSEIDLYSNGSHEDNNKTSINKVAKALVAILESSDIER